MTLPAQASSTDPPEDSNSTPTSTTTSPPSSAQTRITSMSYSAVAHRLWVLERQYHEYHTKFHAYQIKMFKVARCPVMSALGPDHYFRIDYEVSGFGVRSLICAKGEMEAEMARMGEHMRRALAEHRELEIRRRGMVHNMGSYR